MQIHKEEKIWKIEGLCLSIFLILVSLFIEQRFILIYNKIAL